MTAAPTTPATANDAQRGSHSLQRLVSQPFYDAHKMKIIKGDCLEVMREMADDSVDITVTSPPYNLGEGMEDKGGLRVAHNGSKWGGSKLRNGYETHNDAMPFADYVEWQRAVLRECWRVTRGAIYYNHKPRIVKGELRTPLTLCEGLPIRQIIVWDRGSGFNFMPAAYMPMSEWIVLMAKPEWKLRDRSASGVGDVWRMSPDRGNEHPASFPLELPTRAIETSDAQIILDPFAGSGTTLLAAKNLGRQAIGIEVSETYCRLAAEKLSQGTQSTLGLANAEVSRGDGSASQPHQKS